MTAYFKLKVGVYRNIPQVMSRPACIPSVQTEVNKCDLIITRSDLLSV